MVEISGSKYSRKINYKRKANNKTYAGHFDLNDKGDRYEIWSLEVSPRYRNKGYATQMLTEFISQFKFDKPLILYVYKWNEIAIRLYESVGFVITGEYADGEAYKMQLIGSNANERR